MGTILQRRLEEGESIKIDSDALVAYEDSVSFDAQQVGSCCLTFCGGEGCYNTTLKGKEGEGGGLIWIQSYNMDKLDAFLVTVQPKDQKNEGGGAPVSVEMMDR